MIGLKPLRIILNKADRFIGTYNGTRYLVLFGPETYDAIYNRIRYLLSLKTNIRYVFSHYCTKIKVDCYDSLPTE